MQKHLDLNAETVTIPLGKITAESSMLRLNQDSTILIVDDVPANVGTLFDFLKSYGCKILVAEDGASGLQKAEYARPDIILLDVMMPGLDGFETCRRLKANKKTQEIPVIFMTALSDTPFTLRGFDLGAVDYVTKPIQQEEVLARINAQLTVSGCYQDVKEKNKELLAINAQLQQEVLKRKVAENALEKANETLHKLAALDGLTSIANRRVFDEQLVKEWYRMARQSAPLSLIMCDVDYFKRYNDTYGHQAGDRCLKQISSAINLAAKRSQDIVARYGGEEFVILAPGIDTQGMMLVARKIQTQIENLHIIHETSDAAPIVTLSIGVASTIPSHKKSADELLGCADIALYEAKELGRNCIVEKTYTPDSE